MCSERGDRGGQLPERRHMMQLPCLANYIYTGKEAVSFCSAVYIPIEESLPVSHRTFYKLCLTSSRRKVRQKIDSRGR